MNQLRKIINNLDGQPVRKYSSITGRYTDGKIIYHLRDVYGGAVKKCSAEIEIPKDMLYSSLFGAGDNIAISAHLMREFYLHTRMKNDELQQSDSNRQRGYFYIYLTGMRVLQNNIVAVLGEAIRIRLEIKLPVNETGLEGKLQDMGAKAAANQLKKRRKDIISSKALGILLLKNLPDLIDSFLQDFSEEELVSAVMLYRNQEHIRRYLGENGYIAFIGNGAILPRKGMSDYKNPRGAKAFQSPSSMEIDIALPDGSTVSGMGLKKGITVILGDSYQGKSTLLSALYEGIYNHIGGDGREYVLSCDSAMKISAETGRSVQNADISFYLKEIPRSACNAKHFTTSSASGSTAQAAAIFEAVESGCKLMLFDEDSCANNFMYREDRMREILGGSATAPLLDNARGLYEQYGISMVLAVGASAQYLDVADKALLLRDYQVYEFKEYEQRAQAHTGHLKIRPRFVDWSGMKKADALTVILTDGGQMLKIGSEHMDISDILPNASAGQMDFIAAVLRYLTRYQTSGQKTLLAVLDDYYQKIEKTTDMSLWEISLDYLEYVRKYDIMQILYRYRHMQFI